MVDAPAKLPTGPLPHLAMDYGRLRAEGLRLLGELAGEQWTDFNSHDPGVTILEQLCYAITDLAYRINFPIPDLLAGGEHDAHASLPSAATVLSCRPVTRTDLRKLAKDAGAGANAWVEHAKPACPVFHHSASAELHLRPDPTALEAGALALSGLHRVCLPSGEGGGEGSSEASRRTAIARLHGARPLCEDLHVELLRSQPIWIDASVEIEAGVSAQQTLDEIIARVEAYLSPRVDFESLSEAERRHGGSSEAIFEGPSLERGFLSAEALAESGRRREIYTSDLIHAINDVAAVRAVRHLSVAKSASAPPQRWALAVGDDGVPTVAHASKFALLREGLPLPLDGDAVSRALARLGGALEPVLPRADRDRVPEPGRDRRLARYHSVLTQLPQAYGVGRFGLPPSAGPARRAKAKQLQAYLLIFDQLLANAFAQLAHARELFSHFGEAPRTYFTQVVDDPVIDLDRLRADDREAHARWLDGAVVSTAVDELGSLERRARFLDHLLARYAEELDEVDTGAAEGADAEARTLADIRRKLAFLRAYPRISAGRGAGYDQFDPGSRSGLGERLHLELGLPKDGRHPGFEVVEHLLLRPIAEDRGQIGDEGEELVPLLAGVEQADPYSRQLAVVFREPGEGAETFERFVERLVSEHSPAHLAVTLHWLGDTPKGAQDWSDFRRDHAAFRQALADYRGLSLEGAAVGREQARLTQLRLRDSRDRVIEHLGLGGTYPLRDLPVPALLIVPADTPAKISFAFTQAGVTYRLCDHRSGAPITDDEGQRYELVGTGGPAELISPVVVEDVRYSIVAIKPAGNFPALGPRHAWLHTQVTLKEGVDTTLDAAIRAELLDRSIDNPQSTDARLVAFGAEPEVEVRLSQEGVIYELVDDADPERVLSQEAVVGSAGTIVLRCAPVDEDLDLRVRAHKQLDEAEAGEVAREALLDVVLPLRVRADPSLEVEVADPVVDFGASTRVRVRKTQRSARYQLWIRDIWDARYHFDDPPTAATVAVDVGEGAQVRVLRPARQASWTAPPRFTAVASLRKGNGTTLSFALDGLEHDQVVIVQAIKTHELGPLDETSRGVRTSAVQLEQAEAALVRPNPRPALRLRVHEGEAPRVVFEGGQPGVYYALRPEAEGPAPARPAYVHQRDDGDAQLNKGVDQLRVEVDLAIAPADGKPELQADFDRARQAPAPARLDLDASPAGARWALVARKAMTGLEAELEGVAEPGPALQLRVEPAELEAGASATIVVEASEAGERYQLRDEAGEAIGEAVEGDGGPVELAAGAVEQSARFEVLVTPSADDPVVVERLASILVEVPAADADA